jgi:hypothetical protein
LSDRLSAEVLAEQLQALGDPDLGVLVPLEFQRIPAAVAARRLGLG